MSHQSTSKIMVQSFILAHFNYCPLVWYFTSAKQINKMEKYRKELYSLLPMITDLATKNFQTTVTHQQWPSKEYILFAQKY